MTAPGKTQHEKMREHLTKANNALKRAREKAQEGVQSHQDANPIPASPPTSEGTTNDR